MSRVELIRLRVSGLVQGIGFRWFLREHARALGIRGWVSNEPNGDVVAEFGGPVEAVRRLVAAMSRGPEGARVERMAAEPAQARAVEDLPMPFSVKHQTRSGQDRGEDASV